MLAVYRWVCPSQSGWAIDVPAKSADIASACLTLLVASVIVCSPSRGVMIEFCGGDCLCAV